MLAEENIGILVLTVTIIIGIISWTIAVFNFAKNKEKES